MAHDVTETHRALVAALTKFVIGGDTVEGALRSVVQLAVDGIPGAEMAGVSLLDGNARPATRLFTDERVRKIDSAQYAADEGPCLDAWRQGEVTYVSDVEGVRVRYPAFVEEALANDVACVLALPLQLADSTIGALSLYAGQQHAFAEGDTAMATGIASVIATIMMSTSYEQALDLNLHLTRALESRAVIDQAKGIIMATTRCSAEAAFDLLTQQSSAQNRKLRDIAAEIVARNSGLSSR